MKKEHLVPIIITTLVVGGLIFSWVWYQNSKQSTAATTTSTTPKTS